MNPDKVYSFNATISRLETKDKPDPVWDAKVHGAIEEMLDNLGRASR